MTALINVRVADLVGQALDWTVAQVEKPEGFVLRDATADIGCWVIGIAHDAADPQSWLKSSYSPSTDWAQGGPLIQKYGVLLSPKEALIHVHGGPNAGWRESGYWGATIFRKGEHRRKAHNHPDEPLVAAMRCIVCWSFGETVSVPAELVQAVQS